MSRPAVSWLPSFPETSRLEQELLRMRGVGCAERRGCGVQALQGPHTPEVSTETADLGEVWPVSRTSGSPRLKGSGQWPPPG